MLAKGQKAYLPFKRCIDIFGSLLGIIVLSVFLLIAAIITKCTSKGPVIFKQKRAGKDARDFVIYKFRTMKVEAPANVGAEDLTDEQKKNMVTKWGNFMRKTSIDEWPQLFNILKGDMSFIGPRPGLTKEGEPELYEARKSYVPSAYDVKPGLSGYSQLVYKRNPDVYLRAKGDSYYVSHMSFWFDVKLFIMSGLALFGIGYKGK